MSTHTPAPADHALDYLRVRDDFPEPRHLSAIRHYLAERDYTAVAIREIVDHVRVFGSVWCLDQFSGEEVDRREVERLVPGHASTWASFTDAFVWNLGPGA